MTFDETVQLVARGIEVMGMAIIVIGLVAATVAFFLSLRRRSDFGQTYHHYRKNLGRAILLGLEVLVAAEIVATVTLDPSLAAVGAVAIVILVRTLLSFSIEIEIEGRVPWKAAEAREHRERV